MKQGNDGHPPSVVTIDLSVTEPLITQTKGIVLGSRELWVSRTPYSVCVLPGMDPHMTQEKPCQDLCFFDSDEDSLIIGLFDGHGQNGKPVVNFCVKVSNQFYQSNKQQSSENPQKFLEMLTHKCDSDMRISANGIDSSGSGS